MDKAPNEYAKSLGLNKVPGHVGIIMDGNGRWAKKRALPRAFGHRKGIETLVEIIRMSSDIGMDAVSLYAFSTENWTRPAEEIGALMRLLIEYSIKELTELSANNVRLRFMGELEAFPQSVRRTLSNALDTTANNTGMIMNVALNYGGRAEIIRAVKSLAGDVEKGLIKADEIDESMMASRLYTSDIGDPDLIIRTSAEQRLSNFMLWQASYSEYSFPKALWPDFTKDEYLKVLKEYEARDRRFGGVKK